MFDTHAHLNYDIFDDKIEKVLDACRASGVTQVLIPGTDLASSEKALKLAEKYDTFYASAGIYPSDAMELSVQEADDVLVKLGKLAGRSHRIRAIGEIGLDRHHINNKYGETYNDAFRTTLLERQITMFIAQFRLAQEIKKSVIIHNREAKGELISVLEKNWDAYYAGRVVFHCCEPDTQLLDFAIAHDIYVGIDGDVTYNAEKQAFAHKVPLSRLVIETDSPFLTPEPVRSDKQKKFPNSPANLPYIVKKIAEIKEEDIQAVLRTSTNNAQKLFALEGERIIPE